MAPLAMHSFMQASLLGSVPVLLQS